MRIFTASIIQTFAVTALAASFDQWKSRSIYQIVTDRFAVGNGTYPPCNTSERKYCGGDWRGIINNLDYIQNMGFDAIWISPISKQVDSGEEGDPYHGFWAGDLDNLNENFGEDADLKGLVSAVHSREMLFMLDINVNNMGSNSTPTNVSWLLPFMNTSNYHYQCSIPYTLPSSSFSDDDQWALENCWIQDGSLALPDINTENQTLVDMLNTWINVTTGRYNIDGLHISHAMNIPRWFWPSFVANASTFTLAQINTSDTAYASRYPGALDAVQNYPMYYALKDTFSVQDENDSGGDLTELIKSLSASQQMYKKGAFGSAVFSEGVDVPRLPSLTNGDTSLIKNALAFTFGGDSMPVVFYGQEQGLLGSAEAGALNHEALWLSGSMNGGGGGATGLLVDFITSLNRARKIAFKANSDFHNTSVQVIVSKNSTSGTETNSTSYNNSTSTIALYKFPVLTLISAGGNKTAPSWNIPGSALTSNSSSGYGPSQTLVDILTCNVVLTGPDGGILTRSRNGDPLVLLPQDMLADTGTCGVQKLSITGMKSNAPLTASKGGWGKMLIALGVGALLTVV